MSATSTSKQPMMADRPFLRVFDLNNCFNDGFDAKNGSTALCIADQINADGMIIDTIELISRGAAHDINLFLSTSNQVFRYLPGNQSGSAQLVARASSTATGYSTTAFMLPRLLTPVPRVGTEPFSRGLYLPRGFALWAAIDSNASSSTDAPNILIQGGVY